MSDIENITPDGTLRIIGTNAPRDVWSTLIGEGKLNTATESVIDISPFSPLYRQST